MAWIESHTHTIRHTKLIELARELRLKPSYVLGHLHTLWHAALEQREDGDLTSWSDALIADLSDCKADASRYVRLLQKHRWLGYFDAEGNIVPGTEKLIHDWLDYAGNYLRGKYAKRNRPKLEAIWARHGRIYGESGRPSEGQPFVNQSPSTPLPTHLPTHPPNGGGRAEVQEELERAGVSSPGRIAECCATPGVTPVGVALLAEELRAKGDVKDVGAVLSQRIIDGAPCPFPTPQLICRLAKAGRIHSVCGHVVGAAPVKHGPCKLYVGDLCIPLSDLKPENIQLVRGTNGSTY